MRRIVWASLALGLLLRVHADEIPTGKSAPVEKFGKVNAEAASSAATASATQLEDPANAKLRAVVRLPQVSLDLEPKFGRAWGVSADEDIADPLGEYTRGLTGLKKDPADADQRLRLYRLALVAGVTNPTAQLNAALEGFRAQAAASPTNPQPILGLARTLWLGGQEAGAEDLLRQVTRKHTNDWEAWILLGEVLGTRSIKVMTAWETNAPANPMAAYLAGVLKPRGDTNAALAMFAEAESCIATAEKLAPDNTQMWLRRLPFVLDREMRRKILANPPDPQSRSEAISLANQSKAAADVEALLQKMPGDYRLLGLSIYLRVLPELEEFRLSLGPQPDGSKTIDALRSATRAWVRERQERLEKLATDDMATISKFTRAGAAEMAAAYRYVLSADAGATDQFSRLALDLDPRRQRAFALIVAGLVNRQRWSELETLCQKRQETYDGPLVRLLIAKAQFNAGRKAEALATLESAGDKYPDHRLLVAACLAGKLAVLGNRENPRLTSRLTQHYPDPANTPDDTDGNHSVVLCAMIAQAMDGQLDTAKRMLRSILTNDPNDDYAREVMDVVRELGK